jgi:hypothetical protein
MALLLQRWHPEGLEMRLWILFFALFCLATPMPAEDKVAVAGAGVLWREPTDIASRDLIYGAGGKKHAPRSDSPFIFTKEDLKGTNPKFSVKDADGAKWKVKLGVEAKPETAAARLVWAVGYETNEDYLVPKLVLTGLPDHLKRGEKLKQKDGSFLNARLKRSLKDEEKAGTWSWKNNPFSDSRELYGLRVMMALINNWDLKDVNNTVYDQEERKIYLVSDLGASFGTTGESWSHELSKGNLDRYKHSRFITKTTPGYVSFGTPSRPAPIFIFNPHEFFSRVHLEWIGHKIPREDVRWIAKELSKLSPQQIRDAFRAAGYSPDDVEGFASVVEKRIATLQEL